MASEGGDGADDALACGLGGFRQAVVVLNPASGRGRGRRWQRRILQAIANTLGASCSVGVEITTPADGAEMAARRARENGAGLVVVVGGDGTLGSAVNALAGSSVAVALVPMGTGNDFARALGVPLDPFRAVSVLRRARLAAVDLGRLGDRFFINVAGCGFDAAVAERVNQGFRYVRGRVAYVAAVLTTLRRYRAAEMTVTVDGVSVTIPAMLCAVANGTGYGGGMRVAPEARWDDGLLDVCVVEECSTLEFLRAFPRVFRGTHTDHPRVRMFRARQVSIESEPPVPVLMDGELYGRTPASMSVLPRGIRFLVPQE